MWNKRSELLAVLITCLLMEYGNSSWVIYSHFSGFIPSYVYPLELNAGDKIKGILSWGGDLDLDLYLYKSGSDILANSSFLKRQYSSYINPEILEFDIQTSGTYYFRVDLFSSTPSSYKFQIKVNGQAIGTYYDDLVSVSSGRTVKLINFQNNCVANIIYEGSSANIHLMKKGMNITVDSNSIVSNYSSANPKQVTSDVQAMQYSFVIHHQLLSTISYVQFNVTILTPSNSSKCISICDSITYATYLEFNSASRCYCEEGFYWEADKCLIDCSYFNDTGSRVAGSIASCQCNNQKYDWSVGSLKCILNCSRVDNTSGRVGILTTDKEHCTCLPAGFIWEPSTYKCKIVCSMHNSSELVGPIALGSYDVCTCLSSDFEWDSTMNDCRIQCVNFNSTGRMIGSVQNSTLQCQCMINFQWNLLLRQCQVNCQSMNDSGLIGNKVNGSFDQCKCVFPYFYWDNSEDNCVIDCSAFNDTGKVSGIENGSKTSCSCLNLSERVDGLNYQFICFSCDVPFCFECVNYDHKKCTVCQTGFFMQSSQNCTQICGDLLAFSDECDNHLGIQYDGCDDACKVMPDFECRINDSNTLCSFNGTLRVKILSIAEQTPSNKLLFKFSIFPPLNVFKLSDNLELSTIFQIQNKVLSQQKVSYDFNNGIVSVLCSLKEGENFLQSSLFLKFQPSLSFKGQYFATRDDIYNLSADSTKFGFYYYSNDQITISSILTYSSFAIVALGVMIFVAGLFVQKLAGVEVLVVLQFAWLVFVEINTFFLLPFGSFSPLKFTSGYNYPFIAEAEETSSSSPFVSQFSISKSIINNLNISLGLIFILLLTVLITYFRFRKAQKTKQTQDTPSEEINTNTIEKLFNFYSFSLNLLICFLTLSILYSVECLSIFLRQPYFTDFIGLAAIGILGTVLILTLVKYFYDYQSFKVFSCSFKNSMAGKLYYPFFWVCLAASAFLFSFPSIIYAPGIPIGVLFMFTIVFRPYFQTFDNVRVCLNLVVMCGFVGFRTYLSFIPSSDLNSKTTYYLLMSLAGLLVFLVSYAIAITSFFIYKQCRNKSNLIQENQQISKMMRREMIENDFGANLKTCDRSIMNILNNKSHLSDKSDAGLNRCDAVSGSEEKNNLNESAVGLNNEKRENIRGQLKKMKMIKGSLQRNETKSTAMYKKHILEHTLKVNIAEQAGESNLLNQSADSI